MTTQVEFPNEDLKPCACGSHLAAWKGKLGTQRSHRAVWAIHCRKCGRGVRSKASPERAVEAWNALMAHLVVVGESDGDRPRIGQR